jgi:hypothetical protein
MDHRVVPPGITSAATIISCSNAKCTGRWTAIAWDAGSPQDQALAAPHRREAVGLPCLYRETLCRSPEFAKIRRHGEGYDMLPRRQGAMVGSTLYK